MSGIVNDEVLLQRQQLGARFIEKNGGFWQSLRPMICEILGLADTGTDTDPVSPTEAIEQNEPSARRAAFVPHRREVTRGAVAGKNRAIVAQLMVYDASVQHVRDHGDLISPEFFSYETSGWTWMVGPT